MRWRGGGRGAHGISGVDDPEVGVGGDMSAVGVRERSSRGSRSVLGSVIVVVFGLWLGVGGLHDSC